MRVLGVLSPVELGVIVGYQVYQDGAPLTPTTSLLTYDVLNLNPSTTYSFQVQGFDAVGNTTDISDAIQVTTLASASPVWQSIPAQNPITGNAFLLDLANYCTDPDLDTLVFSVQSGTLPTGIVLSGSRLQGTPTTAGQVATITIRASDGFNTADTTIAFHTYSTDISAPPVPSGVSANVISSSQIDLAWAVSTDVAGSGGEFVSGTKDYRIYRDGVLRTTVTGTSYSDTGLAALTTYSYRVSSRDNALNESAQAAAVPATTQGTFGWQTTIATQSLTVGVFFSLDLDTVCTGAATYSLLSGSLPAGISMSGAKNNIVSGTPTTAQNVSPTFRANDGAGSGSAPVWANSPVL